MVENDFDYWGFTPEEMTKKTSADLLKSIRRGEGILDSHGEKQFSNKVPVTDEDTDRGDGGVGSGEFSRMPVHPIADSVYFSMADDKQRSIVSLNSVGQENYQALEQLRHEAKKQLVHQENPEPILSTAMKR